MLGDEFLARVIARLREIRPDILVATGTSSMGKATTLTRWPATSSPIRLRWVPTLSPAIMNTMSDWKHPCDSCVTPALQCCAANQSMSAVSCWQASMTPPSCLQDSMPDSAQARPRIR